MNGQYTPAQIVALLDVDPTAGILAAADLREQRAEAATDGPWVVRSEHIVRDLDDTYGICCGSQGDAQDIANAEHIAAEADPAHALAAARHWRGVVDRHRSLVVDGWTVCARCIGAHMNEGIAWPCPDLTETADEARAYLGGVSP